MVHSNGIVSSWVEDAKTLAAEAHRLIDAGDVVLVKGSKGSRVSLVVDAIRKLGHPLPQDAGEAVCRLLVVDLPVVDPEAPVPQRVPEVPHRDARNRSEGPTRR